MRNKFVFSCSIKICASFYALLESIFCLLLVVEAFSLEKVIEMLEEVISADERSEVSWIGQIRQNFVAQFVQLLKCWLCNVWSGIVMEKNWALSVDQCWPNCRCCSFWCILSICILLRCNGFAGIQKAVVVQSGSRSQNSDRDRFLVQVWLSEVLWSFFLV